jgi:hypothetical protein
MASDQLAVVRDQHRHRPAELCHAGSDPRYLIGILVLPLRA